jgi:hypothetical protein
MHCIVAYDAVAAVHLAHCATQNTLALDRRLRGYAVPAELRFIHQLSRQDIQAAVDEFRRALIDLEPLIAEHDRQSRTIALGWWCLDAMLTFVDEVTLRIQLPDFFQQMARRTLNASANENPITQVKSGLHI